MHPRLSPSPSSRRPRRPGRATRRRRGRARSSPSCAAGCTPARSRSPGRRHRAGRAVAAATTRHGRPAIFAATAALLFGISALYHRGTWSPRAERPAQAAGPLEHLPDHRRHLHAVRASCCCRRHGGARCSGWSGPAALAGVRSGCFWVGAPRWLYTPVYIALGWVAVFYLPDFLHTGGAAVVTLLAVGGGALHASARVVYAPSGPTRHRAGSASTRSSTRSPSRRSSCTTSPSRWRPTELAPPAGASSARLGPVRALARGPARPAPSPRAARPASPRRARRPAARTRPAPRDRDRATPASTRVSSTSRSGWRSRVITGTARWVNSSLRSPHSTPQATLRSNRCSASRAMLDPAVAGVLAEAPGSGRRRPRPARPRRRPSATVGRRRACRRR